MTKNKFDAAARLLRALRKLEEKRVAKLARVDDWTAVEREKLLAEADPEVRKLVLGDAIDPGQPEDFGDA